MYQELINKLERYKNVSVDRAKLDERKKALNSIEEHYEINFCREYRSIMTHVSFENLDELLVFERDGINYDVDIILDIGGHNSIVSVISTYSDRIPVGYTPIATTLFGDLFLVDNSNVRGIVYYWNHEYEFEARVMSGEDMSLYDKTNYSENMTLLSDSFNDFLMCLEVSKDEISKATQIVDDIVLSDDLIKLLNER